MILINGEVVVVGDNVISKQILHRGTGAVFKNGVPPEIFSLFFVFSDGVPPEIFSHFFVSMSSSTSSPCLLRRSICLEVLVIVIKIFIVFPVVVIQILL